MHDRPDAATLLSLARAMLLDELLPLLPEGRRLDARLVAQAMAVAERESASGEAPPKAATAAFAALYPGASPDEPALWRRFALDLRTGDLGERERAVRDILWRLTLARLRAANPRFLAANGFASASGDA